MFLYDEPIELQTSPVKYLGYHLSYNLNKLYHINYTIKKANTAFYYIKTGLKNINNVNADIYFKIIISCIISILSYCDIFLITATKHELSVFKMFHNRLLRYLCGARYDTSIEHLHLFTGQRDIGVQIQLNAAKYWNRLLHVPSTNPLYSIIESKWFPLWRYHLYNKVINNSKYKLQTNQKKSILWTSFDTAIKHKLIDHTNFRRYPQYNMYYKLFKYPHIIRCTPDNLIIVYEPYTDDILKIIYENTIFVYTDGSKKNGFAGFGIYYQYYQINFSNNQQRKNAIEIDSISEFMVSDDINWRILSIINILYLLYNN